MPRCDDRSDGPRGRRRVWPRRGRCRGTAAGLAATVMAGALSLGCTWAQLDGASPAYLIIDSLTGAPGASVEAFGHTLASDVLTDGRVLEDPGRVTFRLALRDPGAVGAPAQPSTANFITITRYRVRYVRADLRDTPGLDVPFQVSGGMTLTVTPDGSSGTLVLVRAQSKLEPPLIGLRGGGGAVVVSTIAEVTFDGQDQAGRAVSVTGQIGITFADWPDLE